MKKHYISSNIGTFPKKQAKKIASLLKKSGAYTVKMRGRGHRYGHQHGGYALDLPIRKATSIALYVHKKPKRR